MVNLPVFLSVNCKAPQIGLLLV